jgi:hypothetical protein
MLSGWRLSFVTECRIVERQNVDLKKDFSNYYFDILAFGRFFSDVISKCKATKKSNFYLRSAPQDIVACSDLHNANENC